MNFCDFLKEKRILHGLTQSEIVNSLMLLDESFNTLTIITYGRWERGVTSPSIKKMLIISRFFNVNWRVFFEKIDLKLSKTQILEFESWLDGYKQTGKVHSNIGYNSARPIKHYVDKCDIDNPLHIKVDRGNLDKIRQFESKVMGLKKEMSHENFISWINSGNVSSLIYYTNNNETLNIEAHSTILLFPESQFNNALKHFMDNEGIVDLEDVSTTDDEPLCIFLHSCVYHDEEWIDYVFDFVIKKIIEDWRISNIIISSYTQEASFRNEVTFKAEKIGTRLNENYKKPVLERILRISSLDFLSQHGIVKKIKSRNIIF